MKIATVIVTYNRLPLLKDAITAIKAQTRQADKIIIVNNYSTDGTKEYLDQVDGGVIEVHNLKQNLGGAGGFSFGLKMSVLEGYDYSWVMDDDCIPEPTALEELVKTLKTADNIGFVASHVKWIDGVTHLRNRPRFSDKEIERIAKIDIKGFNLKQIAYATFVSLLINSSAIKKVGLPISDFFIWHDDIEFTERIIKDGYIGLFAEKSVATHRTETNCSSDLSKLPLSDVPKLYYQVRNSTYVILRDYNSLISYFKVFNRYRLYMRRLNRRTDGNKYIFKKQILKGMKDGLSFHPKIEMIK
jgi:hypothetical protein